MSNKSYRRIGAVEKTGEILKFLAQHKDNPISASAIAEAIKLPMPTVMCHLVTLEDMGFVQSINEHWKFGLGLGLIYARVKANLEGERDRINRDLEAIRIPEDTNG